MKTAIVILVIEMCDSLKSVLEKKCQDAGTDTRLIDECVRAGMIEITEFGVFCGHCYTSLKDNEGRPRIEFSYFVARDSTMLMENGVVDEYNNWEDVATDLAGRCTCPHCGETVIWECRKGLEPYVRASVEALLMVQDALSSDCINSTDVFNAWYKGHGTVFSSPGLAIEVITGFDVHVLRTLKYLERGTVSESVVEDEIYNYFTVSNIRDMCAVVLNGMAQYVIDRGWHLDAMEVSDE